MGGHLGRGKGDCANRTSDRGPCRVTPMSVLGASMKDRLDVMFALAAKQGADEEVLSHWARYLCVLTSGFIEVSLKSILSEYAAVPIAS